MSASAESTGNQGGSRHPRGPGYSYAIVLAVVLVLVAVFLVSPPESGPPAIAAIAPSAVQRIKTPPPQQTTPFGTGQGSKGRGGVGSGGAPSSSPKPRVIALPTPSALRVPRLFDCIGNPPRQIEDPQSPPCVPYWKGSNGGATWAGVTKDSILIAVPEGNGQAQLLKDFETFFNDRFEFYGRHLVLIDTSGDGSSGGGPTVRCDSACSTNQQEQAAIQAKTRGVFASTGRSAQGDYLYRLSLAREHILSAGVEQAFTEAQLAQYQPYLWQYGMATDRMFTDFGNWTCARLVGGRAIHSNDPTLQSKPRKFGALYQENVGGSSVAQPLDTSGFEGALHGCNAPMGPTLSWDNANDSQQADTQRILQLKEAGVTTVACFCYDISMAPYLSEAASEGYFPEWIINDYFANPVADIADAWSAQQHVFGLTFQPRQTLATDDPAIWAVNSVDPGVYTAPNQDTSITRQEQLEWVYRSLLLLASGIQMAGPNLTPNTFAQALHSTSFPNPLSPLFAGKVGFANGTHSMTTDAAEFWWDPSAQSPYRAGPSGAFCYVNYGRRSTGQWPHGGDPFFGPACDSGSTPRGARPIG
jgi:hypothetical protein